MSTPPMPTTKPDRPTPESRPERRVSEPAGTPPQVLPAASSDRSADADLLVDIPQLVVDELTLELESSLILNRVKLDAKGLQAGVFLKADLEHIQEMVQQRSGRQDRVRTGLRELLGGSREQEQRPAAGEQPAHESEREDRGDEQQDAQRDHDGNGAHPARHAAAQGAVAAGLTAAGLAGGALLEARVKPSRKLHIPRRRSRAQLIRDELVKRLP